MSDVDGDWIVERVTERLDAEITKSGVPIGALQRLELIVRLSSTVLQQVREYTAPQADAWQGASTIAGAMQLFDEATVSALQDFERDQLVRACEGRDHVHLDDLPRALDAARAASASERLKVIARLRAEGFRE